MVTYLLSVPDFIPGLFKRGGLVIPYLCGNVLSLSFAPVFVSFDLEQLMASEPVLSPVKWEEWWYLSCRMDKQRGMMWSNSIHTQALKMAGLLLIFLSPQIALLAQSCHLSLGHYCFLSTFHGLLGFSFPNPSLPLALQASKCLRFGAQNAVVHINTVLEAHCGSPLLLYWSPHFHISC